MQRLEHAKIVTMNGSRAVFEEAALVVDAGRIAAIGSTEDLRRAYPQAQAIDLNQRLVMPGLIDAHNHPFNYLVGGYGDDLPIDDLLYNVFYPYERFVTPDDAYVGALATYAEMIRSGVTCFNDPGGYMPDMVGAAAQDIGMRGIVNRSTRDIVPANSLGDTTAEAIRAAVTTVERWNGAADGRLRAWLGLRTALSASDDLVREIGDLGRTYKVGVHTHAAASASEGPASLKKFGKRTFDRYRDLGLMGPNLYAVHMGFLEDDEIADVAASGLKIAHCPIAALAGAWGIVERGRIPELMERGVTVAIGSDTNFGSGTLDMFRQMFVCAVGHRESHGNPRLIGADKALAMATCEAAKAMMWDDEIGSLEVGKKADLIVVDTRRLEWHYPGRDIARSIVYSGARGDVESVMIDGQWVMRERKILTIDEDDLVRRMRKAGAAWKAKADRAA